MWLKFDGNTAYVKLNDADSKEDIIKIGDFTIDEWIHIERSGKVVFVNGKKIELK